LEPKELIVPRGRPSTGIGLLGFTTYFSLRKPFWGKREPFLKFPFGNFLRVIGWEEVQRRINSFIKGDNFWPN